MAGPWSLCHADAMRFCDRQAQLSAGQQDQLFRFGALVKAELDKSGLDMALVSRSGLDLSRFKVRYSHAGFALKDSENAPWSVRQLYYACDERKPRIFDQGLSGFLLGTDNPTVGYLSVLLLPPAASGQLARIALDKRLALQVLSPNYSANAYAFGLRYQNCNQWVMELLASAWAPVPEGAGDEARAQAQRWLQAEGYVPSVMVVGSRPLMWAGHFVPLLHNDDHPQPDLDAQQYRVSMPASIEAFVRAQVPEATRMEFCHIGPRVVVHRGWDPIAEGCEPGPGDVVLSLD